MMEVPDLALPSDAQTTPMPALVGKAQKRRNVPTAPDKYRRANTYASVYIVASAALTAVPVGMNRPVLWLIWGALTAAVVAAYVVVGHRADQSRRLISWAFWPMFAAAFLVPIWAIIQFSLPVSIVFPSAPEVTDLIQNRISALPTASLLGALRFVSYLLFFFLAIEVSGRGTRAVSMGYWIFWAIVLHAVWGLVALNLLGDIHIWGADKSSYQGFATGTFINRNSFASFLAMGAVLGFTLLQDRIDNPIQRKARTQGLISSEVMDTALMALGILVICVALLATASRMGVFSAAVGMFISFLAMRLRSNSATLRGVLIFVYAAAILGGIGIFAVGQELAWRSFFIERNSIGRVEVYSAVLAQIAERPLIGYGFDAFRPAFEWSSTVSEGDVLVWDRAHSTYLSHWLELGLLVGSVPIILVGLCLARAIQLWRQRSIDYALPVAACAVIASQGLHSTVDFSLEMPANVVLFLAIVALGIAPRNDKKQHVAEQVALLHQD
jgi:O-antigen ligase